VNDLRERIMHQCFVPYEGRFSNGERANNKLDLDLLNRRDPDLFTDCIIGLGKISLKHEADFVVGVPDGATMLAKGVSVSYHLRHVELFKYGDSKEVEIRFDEDEMSLEREHINRGLVIEDVTRTFSNIRKVLELPELEGKIVAAAAVFDRGDTTLRNRLPVPFEALAQLYIPPMLPPGSTLWQYADASH
jgi:orotate phosphoribosyltransferase